MKYLWDRIDCFDRGEHGIVLAALDWLEEPGEGQAALASRPTGAPMITRLVYWLGVALAAALSGLLAANNLSSSVSLGFGAEVAKWRHVLFIAVVSFALGGMLDSGLISSSVKADLLPLQDALSSADALRCMVLVLCLLVWNLAAHSVALFFSYPLPSSLMILTSFIAGAYFTGLSGGLAFLFKVSVANAVVCATAVALSGLAYSQISALLSNQTDPLTACLNALPVLYLLVIPAHLTLLFCGHLVSFQYGLSPAILWTIGGVMFIVSAVLTFAACRMLLVNRTKRHVFERYPQHVLEYGLFRGGNEENLAERGMVVGRNSPAPSSSKDSTNSTLNRSRAEESFAFLLMILSGLNASVQGILDIGLLAGVLEVFEGAASEAGLLELHSSWVFAVLCLSALGGMALLGKYVAHLLGKDIVVFGPSLAVSVELGCTLPTLLATFLGFPTSPILCKLPAMLFVGWIAGRDARTRPALIAAATCAASPIAVALPVALTFYVLLFLPLPLTLPLP